MHHFPLCFNCPGKIKAEKYILKEVCAALTLTDHSMDANIVLIIIIVLGVKGLRSVLFACQSQFLIAFGTCLPFILRLDHIGIILYPNM